MSAPELLPAGASCNQHGRRPPAKGNVSVRYLSKLTVSASGSLLFTVAVAAAEFVDTSGGVHKFLLACEERVGRAGDFELHERILLAVDLDGLAGSHSRTGDESLLV